MNSENLKKVNHRHLGRSQNIILKAIRGEQEIKAVFLASSDRGFSARLEGAPTGFPFKEDEWTIWVEIEYPLPARSDIETVIYNAIAQGRITDNPPSYGDMADALIALIKGETPTPVPLLRIPEEPTPEQEQQFEAAHTQDWQEDADILLEEIEPTPLRDHLHAETDH